MKCHQPPEAAAGQPHHPSINHRSFRANICRQPRRRSTSHPSRVPSDRTESSSLSPPMQFIGESERCCWARGCCPSKGRQKQQQPAAYNQEAKQYCNNQPLFYISTSTSEHVPRTAQLRDNAASASAVALPISSAGALYSAHSFIYTDG